MKKGKSEAAEQLSDRERQEDGSDLLISPGVSQDSNDDNLEAEFESVRSSVMEEVRNLMAELEEDGTWDNSSIPDIEQIIIGMVEDDKMLGAGSYWWWRLAN